MTRLLDVNTARADGAGPLTAVRQVWPLHPGLLYEVDEPADRVLDVELDGRRAWSFREGDHPLPEEPLPAVDGVLRFQPWPPELRQRLRGTFTVGLRVVGQPSTDRVPTARVSLDGDESPLDLTDAGGRPLVVNKWGRLGYSLAAGGDELAERLLDSMDAIRDVLQQHLGDRVLVNGGTLLGPVREGGALLPHDDDADLAYLSRLSHPVDVALENFELGRRLRAAGHTVLRLSAVHLQITVQHEGVSDHYVDVFSGFRLDGWWYQAFAVRARVAEEELLPTSVLSVVGRPEPAPRRPERMLEAIYGPSWETPDPAFRFEVPDATGLRFYGWFGDLNVERELWEERFSREAPVARPSALARAVLRETPAESKVLELGCGAGADAVHLAAAGRTVHAVDYSRSAVDAARDAAGTGLPVAFDVLNLYDTRAVVRLGAQLAQADRPWTVWGRRLLDSLEEGGRANVFRLCSMLLRRGTAAHFDLLDEPDRPAGPAHRRLTVQQIVDEAARHRLYLDEAEPRTESAAWFDPFDERLVSTCRLTFRRRNA